MPRLFTALEIPRDAALSLSLLRGGLPGARWIDVENYHLTLRFIGDVEGHVADEIANALDRVRRPSFPLALSGVGAFGSKKPHSIWAGVTGSPDLAALQAEIERICQRIGVAADPRKFVPHGTAQEHQPDRRGSLSFGAGQFFHGVVPGRPFRPDVVARFGRRRALYRRGSLAAHCFGCPPIESCG
jgi:2'-5' RNA ligase